MKRFKRNSVFILTSAVILVLSYFEQTMVEAISIYGLLILSTTAMTLGFYLVLDGIHNAKKYVAVRIAHRKNTSKR